MYKPLYKKILCALVPLVFLSMAAPVYAGYTNVSPNEAHLLIQNNPGIVILDVRTTGEYASGHIENAIVIPVTQLEGRINELNSTRIHLVYCQGGSRSATASNILVNHGFQNVYNLLGGITSWINAGFTIVGPNQPPGVTIAFPQDESIVADTIIISGTATDPDGVVQKVEVKIDGGAWMAATGTTTWTYEWNTHLVTNGLHTISARSYDGEEYSLTKIIEITIENLNEQLSDVTISPGNLTISPGDVFTLNITVVPGEEIAGIQFDLYFDPSLLQIDEVKQGDLFQGLLAYFNNGTIDNISGTLTNVYGSAIGGHISLPGSFASVTFSAKQKEGTSLINLSQVIVGSPWGTAVPINVFDGNVTITSLSPGDLNGDGRVNILDIIAIGQHWDEKGDPGWIQEDVNTDGTVNILDLILISRHWTG